MPKSAKKSTAVPVFVRRIGKPAGAAKIGEFVLIVNPKVFGSTGQNWLGGKSFATREAALEAAPKLGGRVE